MGTRAAREPARLRVLIVEDDAAIATVLAMLLGMVGLDATTAGDGAQALRALAAGPAPDALLLDIRLPTCGPDGIALARQLRARREWSRVAILLMTAESYDEDAALAEAGADAFIRKPVPDADELAALIRRLAAARYRGDAP